MMSARSNPANSGRDADSLTKAGLEAHQARDFLKASDLYSRALKRDPTHDRALRLLIATARAFAANGQIGAAIAAWIGVVEVAPDLVEAQSSLARLHATDGANDTALRHARIALALEPNCVDALCSKVMGLSHLRRFDEADSASLIALDLAPEDVGVLKSRAEFLAEADRFAESFELFRKAAALAPNDVVLLAAYAGAFERDGDLDAALSILDRAQALAPGSLGLMFSRARCLRDQGQTDAAQSLLQDIIRRDPNFSPAYRFLVRMKRMDDPTEVRAQLSRLTTAKGISDRFRIDAGFALGDLLSDSGDYDGAFPRYRTANELSRAWQAARGQRFDRKELDLNLALVVQRFGREFGDVPASWGNATEQPIFVVGPTRSGTTLVEQICASHSRVEGLGELTEMVAAGGVIELQNRDRAHVAEWNGELFRAEADKIAAKLGAKSGGALRYVDKNPSNIMRLGLISAMFPRARIIWCRRDPRDVIVSNYMLNFSDNLWSTDLVDAAYAVRRIDQIGRVWESLIRIPMLEVVYEDLVADLEPQVRRIIDFLDLEWEPSCLAFHETQRRVATPSEWQVRQPIYTSSIGRWRRYERHLGPMLKALATPLPDASVP